MEFRILLLYIASHLIADFMFQNKSLIELRFHKEILKSLLGNFLHVGIHFFTALAFYIILNNALNLSFMGFLNIAWRIVGIHFILDILKSLVHRKKILGSFTVLIVDQILHLSAIIIIVMNYFSISFYSLVKPILGSYPTNIHLVDKCLIMLIVVITCTFVVGVFIRDYLNRGEEPISKPKEKYIIEKTTNYGIKNGGFIIGVMERLFILLIITIGQPGMIGFVLTAKSIVRFKRLDEEGFAEYFIIGTLISFIVGILGGVLIYNLNVIPIIK